MLDRFAWKKSNLANCRCPICGDSQKNKSKARGFFYQKGNSYFYKCHNCGHGCSLYNLLKDVSPQLAKEYSLEKWKKGSVKKEEKQNDMFGLLGKKPEFKNKDKVLDSVDCITELPKNHMCLEFVNMRKIPKEHWNKLYYTDDFGSFMKKINPEHHDVVGAEPRLIIPFFNKKGDVVAAQGRSINFKDDTNRRRTVKYITVKSDHSSDRLWYGQWRVDPKKRIYIVEGPIDSLFLRNSIAMVGAGALDQIPTHLKHSEGVYVLDNEPRNLQIVRYNERLIELGKTVCIWPRSIREKDINDMVYKMSTRKIENIIDQNSYSGLEAVLKLNEWRKI
tara:strand:+ start:176 stop:1177 length:1002 start_codon:yes stop_codon:yes gene_type:complete